MQSVPMTEHHPLLVIVGPTAVGKTEIAVKLAREFNGEIISADSRQVYRYMNIGTAKPTAREQEAAQHHLIDILNPDEELSLAQFQELAYRAINSISGRGHLPILVGGTGQYVRAVVEGWGIPEVPPQSQLRVDLEAFAESYGATALHARLAQLDPEAATAIDWRNIRRVVRAIEVCVVSGRPISKLQQRNPPPYRILILGLTRNRDELYRRLDERIEYMIETGLVRETQSLLDQGYTFRLASMSTLGYPEVGAYLRGEFAREEMVAAIKGGTRRFVRHQYNWFQLDDTNIRWFNLSQENHDGLACLVHKWLAASS